MDMIFVPKPIFSKTRDVEGYYLSFQNGNALLEEGKAHSFDLNVDLPFFDLVNRVGLEVLTFNKKVFVPVTDIQLATDIENGCVVDYSMVVLMLNKRTSLTDANLRRVKRFKELGFLIAFFDFHSITRLDAFLPYTDYLFCDRDADQIVMCTKYINMKGGNTQIIAKNVDASKEFDVAVFFGVDLLEGQFYKYVTNIKNNQVSPLQLNYIQLLKQIGHQNFEFGAFAKIILRDTALALQFLKMVNSSKIKGDKIKSLKHAAAMLGQNEIERWIKTAVTSMMSQERPGEISRISLIRAKFCENMAVRFELGVHKDNLFLMGLFSVLDVILDMPIDMALSLVLVPDMVRDALTEDKGEYAQIMQFVKLYEQGNWYEVSRIALIHGIEIKDIYDAYLDTLIWYGNMINLTVEDDDVSTENDADIL